MSDANSTQTIQRQTFAASGLVSCPALYVLQLTLFFYEPNCFKIPTRSTSMAVGYKNSRFSTNKSLLYFWNYARYCKHIVEQSIPAELCSLQPHSIVMPLLRADSLVTVLEWVMLIVVGVILGCEYGDRVGWCRQYIRSEAECRQPSVAAYCCQTCQSKYQGKSKCLL